MFSSFLSKIFYCIIYQQWIDFLLKISTAVMLDYKQNQIKLMVTTEPKGT